MINTCYSIHFLTQTQVKDGPELVVQKSLPEIAETGEEEGKAASMHILPSLKISFQTP